MNIAFISANQETLPDPVIPLGLFYIMGSISNDYTKYFWDLCFESEPLDYIKKQINNVSLDAIIISMRNIQNSDYTSIKVNLSYYSDLVATIKSLTDCPIILGGSGFSVIPEQLMDKIRPTFGISGEGEGSISLLLESIKNKETNYSKIPSLFYYQENELIRTERSDQYLNINDHLPLKGTFGAPYYKLTGIDSIQTKRGCPFKCSYCTYPKIEGTTYRLRSPKLVVKEMLSVKACNPDVCHYFIVDSVFNHPIDYAKSVCNEMIDKKQPLPWTCYVSPRELDSGLLKLMKKAGCVGVELGSDSGVNEVLDNLRKGFKTDDIQRAHDLCVEHGILDCHTFVLGTTGETLEQVNDSLEFIDKLQPHSAIMMIWSDDNTDTPAEIIEERTKRKNEILKLLKEKSKKNPNWIVPASSINYNPKMLTFLRKRGIRGPLWQHL